MKQAKDDVQRKNKKHGVNMYQDLVALGRTLRLGLWPGIVLNTLLFSYFLGSVELLSSMLAVGLCLASSFAFLLNDLRDQKIDHFNEIRRLEATENSYIVSGILLAVGLTAILTFLSLKSTGSVFFAFLSIVLGVILYSFLFDRLSYTKNLTAAAVALSPVWLAGFASSPGIEGEKLASFVLICFGLFLYLLAREIRFDEFDQKGDRAGGRITLAHLFSKDVLFVFEGLIIFGGTVLLLGALLVIELSLLRITAGALIVIAMGATNFVPLFYVSKTKYFKTTRVAMYLSPLLGLMVFG